MTKKTVCVVGLGYIGLPTAALLASNGFQVVGVDLNVHAVETINQGRVHIVEPDLDAFVRSAVTAGRLQAFTTPRAADVYMICVPTPFHEGEGIPQPNIDYVLAATRSIAGLVKAGDMVILESTSPVGTTQRMADELAAAGVDVANVHMAYCPERVLPGKIMTELVENDRVVGGLKPEDTHAVTAFYRSFVRGAVLETDAKTAEMCKLTENSFRDVNIAFANELSMICAKDGINVWNLIQLANRHPRVNILQPGAGVGGHCIAVDPWFIVSRDPENARLIRSAREVNNYKTEWAIQQIKVAVADASARVARKPKVACLGLAFKPDIDDLRESPAVHIATALQSQGYDVVAVEPNIESHDAFPLMSLEDAMAQADVLVVLVKHRQFADEEVRAALARANALDFCGVLM
ncbi:MULTISPECIES: UDP-N-acetyl-D-mannosamine dehydrogenase [unclassified Cupriavidus]|uniref:UDP-N-acetyl-D-mannosamine dehydrogenase n=1 Tax=unclassified Cupriavidus TaxID=2640874 RepID=UPI0010F72ED1|nr:MULTISPECIES: UDP-N-acetyl-D-mannosamine dehydrogenase [unclassified Cupriavidus]MWL88202.1 UDP-N-acetyl-D-mannosamine dehydrogenase [Cupriavidus sp. SW-Y-13]